MNENSIVFHHANIYNQCVRVCALCVLTHANARRVELRQENCVSVVLYALRTCVLMEHHRDQRYMRVGSWRQVQRRQFSVDCCWCESRVVGVLCLLWGVVLCVCDCRVRLFSLEMDIIVGE